MQQNPTPATSRDRQKTFWSLSTEHEQRKLWDLERKILIQIVRERASNIILLRWKKRHLRAWCSNGKGSIRVGGGGASLPASLRERPRRRFFSL